MGKVTWIVHETMHKKSCASQCKARPLDNIPRAGGGHNEESSAFHWAGQGTIQDGFELYFERE